MLRIIIIGLGGGGIRERKGKIVYRIRLRRVMIWGAAKNVIVGRVREGRLVIMNEIRDRKGEITLAIVR